MFSTRLPLCSYFKKMQEGSVKRGIVAVQSKITPMARVAIQEMKPQYTLEQFTELELMVNITEHMYVMTLPPRARLPVVSVLSGMETTASARNVVQCTVVVGVVAVVVVVSDSLCVCVDSQRVDEGVDHME